MDTSQRSRITPASQYVKRRIGIDVLAAARQRIAYAFDNFERVYLSFSGGKDSTVMLHLAMDESIARNRKIGILFIDLEGQYKLTIDFISESLARYSDHIEVFWVSLPIHLRNAVSVYEPFWLCWDPEAEAAWIRRPPKDAITDEACFPFFSRGMEFEEFTPEFGAWYAQGKTCACLVGIRTDESLNRFRTIARMHKEMWNGKQWTTRVIDQQYNVYPIYDWSTEDIWTYHAKFPDRPYNRLYDLMHKAGLTPHQMRICQPYGDDQRRGLWLFHLIEPETWARVVARVNGANQGAMYVQESGNMTGYRSISKPQGHTWKSFAELLLSSMPPKTQEHFGNKIAIFNRWWTDRGYAGGIPDEADYKMEAQRLVPSWRRVCKSLLRNDYWCKGLSFTQHRSAAYEKYLDLMKRRKAQWSEPAPKAAPESVPAWEVNTEGKSTLRAGSRVLARVLRLREGVWNWVVYSVPIQEGTSTGLEEAKRDVSAYLRIDQSV
jgi:predicted phosphoadenosine phosphosulfate sulfurtransferase